MITLQETMDNDLAPATLIFYGSRVLRGCSHHQTVH